MNGSYRTLAARLREGIEELAQVVEQTQQHWGVARTSNDQAYWNSVALNLHSYYVGAERLCEDIAQTVDRSVPSGRNWHMDLLRQMSTELASLRPAVLSPGTRACLDEYREFRHVVRNVYTFHLRPTRLDNLAAELGACFDSFSQDIAHFAAFLDQVAQADDQLATDS